MLDAALIKACADPSLKPAIVRQFVEVVGADDPLTITIRSGEQLVLLPRPRTSAEAMELVRQYLGRASVRVGLTQYPAGIGITNAGDQQRGIIEPCDNLKMGTAMFAKVMRIVAKSFKDERTTAAPDQIFDAAVGSWRTGMFEGKPVFSAPDPDATKDPMTTKQDGLEYQADPDFPLRGSTEPPSGQEVGNAGIRIDLSRIGGEK